MPPGPPSANRTAKPATESGSEDNLPADEGPIWS